MTAFSFIILRNYSPGKKTQNPPRNYYWGKKKIPGNVNIKWLGGASLEVCLGVSWASNRSKAFPARFSS